MILGLLHGDTEGGTLALVGEMLFMILFIAPEYLATHLSIEEAGEDTILHIGALAMAGEDLGDLTGQDTGTVIMLGYIPIP